MTKKRKEMTGGELRQALLDLGLTQAAFAALLGVPLRTVSHWCTTQPPPTAGTLTRLIMARPELVAVIADVMDRPAPTISTMR